MKNILLLVFLAACAGRPVPAAPPTPAPAPAPAPAAFEVRVVGHGPPILFFPGLASPGWVWDDAVAHLADRYTCHVFTLAGFAGVPALPPPFLSRERDAVLAYIEENQLQRPVLVGHSLGAVLAYAVASRTEVAGLLAVDGAPFLPALGDPAATAAASEPRAAMFRDRLATMSPADFAAQNRSAVEAMVTAPADVERVAAAGAKSDPATVGQAVYDVMTTDLRPDVAAIAAPVWLIVAGPSLREAYAAQLPGRTIRVAEHARHFVMLDDPGFLRATLDELLVVAR